MTYKILSPEGECILYVILLKCPCLNQYSIGPLLMPIPVANVLYCC